MFQRITIRERARFGFPSAEKLYSTRLCTADSLAFFPQLGAKETWAFADESSQ